MRRPATLLTGTVAFALALAGTAHADRALSATLLGANEVPGPGDPDGSGTAELTVNPGLRELCYTLTVADIAPATAAHVHRGGSAEAGPVVVTLAPPTDGTSSGCVTVDRALAVEIVRDPAAFYVNVHNAEYRAGAVRGQLG